MCLQAQGGYERRVQEELEAKQQKEAEIARLVGAGVLHRCLLMTR